MDQTQYVPSVWLARGYNSIHETIAFQTEIVVDINRAGLWLLSKEDFPDCEPLVYFTGIWLRFSG
jgi:hypothetical protein